MSPSPSSPLSLPPPQQLLPPPPPPAAFWIKYGDIVTAFAPRGKTIVSLKWRRHNVCRCQGRRSVCADRAFPILDAIFCLQYLLLPSSASLLAWLFGIIVLA
jgi:hypothetical protein